MIAQIGNQRHEKVTHLTTAPLCRQKSTSTQSRYWEEPDHVPVSQFIWRTKPQFILWITQLWRTRSERKRRKQMLSPQLIDKGRSRHIWIPWKLNIFNMTSSSSLWQIRIRCSKLYSQVIWFCLEIHSKKPQQSGGGGTNFCRGKKNQKEF